MPLQADVPPTLVQAVRAAVRMAAAVRRQKAYVAALLPRALVRQ